MDKHEIMKVIAEGNSKTICPLVNKIAELTVEAFELAAESSFEHDEDEILFNLMMRLFVNGQNMEAVDVLAMTFSLIGADEAFMLVALIASTGRENVYDMFMHRFMEISDRCEIARVEFIDLDELS